MQERVPSTPEQIVGPYRIVKWLGSGGMAEVLMAVRRGAAEFQKPVALKRILRDLLDDATFRRMLQREAALAAMMQHPNIVDVFELAEYDGELLLSMELLFGLDAAALGERLRAAGRPLRVETAARLVVDAAHGLSYAHALCGEDGRPLGIVHRDVSPHNLFVGDGGVTKVVDFGIATAVGVLDGETRTGALKGKFRFMAPEQVNLKELDATTDVWGLGVTLWELIAGRPLFPGTAAMVIDAIRSGPIPTLGEVGCRVPSGVEDAIRAALCRDRAGRCSSAGELARMLSEATPLATYETMAQLVDRAAGSEIRANRALLAAALQTGSRLARASEESPPPAADPDTGLTPSIEVALWTEEDGLAETQPFSPSGGSPPVVPLGRGLAPAMESTDSRSHVRSRTRPIWAGDLLAFVLGGLLALALYYYLLVPG